MKIYKVPERMKNVYIAFIVENRRASSSYFLGVGAFLDEFWLEMPPRDLLRCPDNIRIRAQLKRWNEIQESRKILSKRYNMYYEELPEWTKMTLRPKIM